MVTYHYLPDGTVDRCEGSTVRGRRCRNWTRYVYRWPTREASLCNVHAPKVPERPDER